MRKITFNKSDYTGQEMTIKVKKDGSFVLYDYSFKLVLSGDDAFEVISDNWSYPLVRGFKDPNDRKWVAGDDGYHMTRTHEDPFVAAAQLLCNMI